MKIFYEKKMYLGDHKREIGRFYLFFMRMEGRT